jgi:hypothetical protein
MHELKTYEKRLAAFFIAVSIIGAVFLVVGTVTKIDGGSFRTLWAFAMTALLTLGIYKAARRVIDNPERKLILAEDNGSKSEPIPALFVRVDSETDKVILTPYGKLYHEYIDAEAKAADTAEVLEVFYRLLQLAEPPADQAERWAETIAHAREAYQALEVKHILKEAIAEKEAE